MWIRDDKYEALGTRMRVRSQDEQISDYLARLWGGFLLDRPAGVRGRDTVSIVSSADGPVLYRDCSRAAAGSAPAVQNQALAELNRLAVTGYTGFAAHSGVVARNGVAVAFPNESGGGKTTLTAAFIRGGLDYVSDESLCIDLETGEVEVYAKPLTFDARSAELLGLDVRPVDSSEVAVTAEEIGGTIASGPLRLGHVVLAEYGHDEPSVEALPASEVMGALLRMSFNNYKHPEASFKLAATLAQQVRGWRLRYGKPGQAVEVLSEVLG